MRFKNQLITIQIHPIHFSRRIKTFKERKVPDPINYLLIDNFHYMDFGHNAAYSSWNRLYNTCTEAVSITSYPTCGEVGDRDIAILGEGLQQ